MSAIFRWDRRAVPPRQAARCLYAVFLLYLFVTSLAGQAALGQVERARIEAAVVSGAAGEQVEVGVTLRTAGYAIAGVQLDLAFAPGTMIGLRGARPDCTVNPEINKAGTGFSLRPPQCTVGLDCELLRVLVLALDNVDPIADGAELFRCRAHIAPDAAPGEYPLSVGGVIASDPSGAAIPGPLGVSGAIIVTGLPATTALRASRTQAAPGQREIGITISLDNAEPVRAVQLSLADIPDELALSPRACGVTARATGLSCFASQTENEIRLVLLATGQGAIAAGSGAVATVYVDDVFPVCAAGSDIELRLSQGAVADVNGEPLAYQLSGGSITCGCRGDVNADGATDVLDMLACVDSVLGRRFLQSNAADANCDQTIDVLDCLRLLDIALGRRPPCPACAQ